MKIYLCAPFFSEAEITAVKRVEEILTTKGLDFWSPRLNQFENLETGSSEWSLRTYYNDKQAMDFCDVLVGIYHGNYSDSGSAFEMGYFVGNNKPIILLHLGSDSNLMCHEGALANLMSYEDLEAYDFTELKSIQYTGKMF